MLLRGSWDVDVGTIWLTNESILEKMSRKSQSKFAGACLGAVLQSCYKDKPSRFWHLCVDKGNRLEEEAGL